MIKSLIIIISTLIVLQSSISSAQTVSYFLSCDKALRTNDYKQALKTCKKQLALSQSSQSLFDEAKILLSLAVIHHQLSNSDSQIKFLRLLKKHSLFKVEDELEYSWNRQFGKIEYLSKNLDLSKHYFTSALNIALNNNNFIWQSKSFNDLAIVEREQGNYSQAMIQYEKSLKLKQNHGDFYSIGLTLRSIALTLIKLEEYDQAIQYLTLSLQSFLQYLNNSDKDKRVETNISFLYEDFAQTYILMGKHELAKTYSNKIIDTIELKFSQTATVRAYINLSRIYKGYTNFEEALSFLGDAEKLISDQDYVNRLAIHFELATILNKKNDYKNSIKQALAGLKLSRKILSEKEADFLKLLSFIYKESNPEISLHYLEQYIIHREQFLEKKYNDNLKTVQHRIKMKNVEFELERKKNDVQELINWTLTIIIFLLLSIGYISINLFSKKKEKQVLLQSINHHKQQLLLLESALDKSSQYNETESFLTILVNAMVDALNIWESHTSLNRIELAEKSKIWTVTIDNGTLRTRSLDKYLSRKYIPHNPRWKNVVKTCHFILTDTSLSSSNRRTLERHLELIMKHVKELSVRP